MLLIALYTVRSERQFCEQLACNLVSREHFSLDGTLIEAWAILESFKKKDASNKDEPPPDDPGNPSVDSHGEKRSNETHESTTDPDAKLARKGSGKEAKLSHSTHALIENRNGLLVAFQMDQAARFAQPARRVGANVRSLA